MKKSKTGLCILLVLSIIYGATLFFSNIILAIAMPTLNAFYTSHPEMLEAFHATTAWETLAAVPRTYFAAILHRKGLPRPRRRDDDCSVPRGLLSPVETSRRLLSQGVAVRRYPYRGTIALRLFPIDLHNPSLPREGFFLCQFNLKSPFGNGKNRLNARL